MGFYLPPPLPPPPTRYRDGVESAEATHGGTAGTAVGAKAPTVPFPRSQRKQVPPPSRRVASRSVPQDEGAEKDGQHAEHATASVDEDTPAGEGAPGSQQGSRAAGGGTQGVVDGSGCQAEGSISPTAEDISSPTAILDSRAEARAAAVSAAHTTTESEGDRFSSTASTQPNSTGASFCG
jgi:hypothetical protein